MRWSNLVVMMLGAGLLAGCQLLVTFESVPEGSGGGGDGGAGATTAGGGGSGGNATTSSTGTTTSAGGTTCQANCCSPADCPPPPGPCSIATCVAGQCGVEQAPDGTGAATQTHGDCRRLVCQGGAPTSVDDALDVLDDENPCTFETCQGTSPKSTPLGQNTSCMLPGAVAGVCNGKGKCVECMLDNHCPMSAPECEDEPDAGICVPQTCTNNTVDGGETAQNCGGPDCPPCDKGKACIQGTDCHSGVCGLVGCVEPTCFDGVANGSESDVDCGNVCQKKCLSGQRCNKNNDCQGNQCTGQGGVCVANCDDDLKNNTETDADCGGGACAPCGAGKACGAAGANCLSGVCGPAGTCEPGELATPCSADTDCISGACTDGVCCNGSCTGTCKSCKLPGSTGTCTNIPAGQDPQNECLGACNGSGSCTL